MTYMYRYNARDATWWFLQSVQDYCAIAPEGLDVLKAPINRLFPFDEQEKHYQWKEKNEPITMPLSEVIQEILTKHANGTSIFSIRKYTEISWKIP